MGLWGEWMLARYVHRRGRMRNGTICRRKSDGSLWAASCPQDFGRCMAPLFTATPGGRGSWHFVKVRIWRGLPVVSQRIVWLPASREFDVLQEQRLLWLPRWSVEQENALLDQLTAAAA